MIVYVLNKHGKPHPLAKEYFENGILCSLDSSGRNIMFNDFVGEWVRKDEFVWHYFGKEKQNGREIIHIDGDIRNDNIENLRLA